eukprot:m.3273 g.3273  ORF g.3273 m.3273 type:complete len:383 (+) comp2723_c0_seq1:169-1317(+)
MIDMNKAITLVLAAAITVDGTRPVVFSPYMSSRPHTPCYREPSLVAVPGKPGATPILVAFANARCDAGDGCYPAEYRGMANTSSLEVSRSMDGGLTWVPASTVYSFECAGKYPGGPILTHTAVYDPYHDCIHVLYFRKGGLTIATSADGGVSWKTTFSNDGDVGPTVGDGIVTTNGEVVLLSSHVSVSNIYKTADGGRTWQWIKTTPATPFTAESQTVTWSAGRLYTFGHVHDGSLLRNATVSQDGGTTWSTLPFLTPFNLTLCAGGMTGSSPVVSEPIQESKTIFFSHPDSPYSGRRHNGTIWRASDDGRSWERVLSITGDGDTIDDFFAYSVMTTVSANATHAHAAMIYETGGNECNVTLGPRYSPSCRMVFTWVDLPLL